MKKLIILGVLFLSVSPFFGAVKISHATSPLKLTAGENANITIYCVDATSSILQKGVKVKLSVLAGGGKISPTSETSDVSGTIKAVLTTGAKPGTNVVKVEAVGVEKALFISVTGDALPPSDFSASVEPGKVNYNQSAVLTVVVKNAKGAPYKDAEVKFNPIDFVTVTPMTGKTDENGIVKATVKAGKQAGATRIEVAAGSLDIRSVDFEVIAPTASNVAASASSNNIGTRGRTTLKAKVFDTANEPMANIPINFQIESGDATLNSNQASTDATGSCQVELTAGTTAGVVVVKVGNKDFTPVDVKINVSSVVLPPAFLTAKSVEENVIAGDEVTLTATVEDREKRLMSGTSVKFDLISGGGSLLSGSGTTDTGKASTIFTAGTTPGKSVIKVSCGNLPPVNITITVEASGGQATSEKSGKAEKLFIYTASKNPSIFAKPMVTALITDASNLPVANSEVKFSSSAKGVSFSPASAKTGPDGTAQTEVGYLGLGKIRVTASGLDKDETVQIIYKIPEWAWLFPSIVLFGLIRIFYMMRKAGLKVKLVEKVTGLNTDLFVKYRVNYLLAKKKEFTVCFLDVDDFKNYNLAAGFARGEKVLTDLAAIIKSTVPSSDVAAHLGGDDFVYICDPKKAKSIADKIAAEFKSKLMTYYNETDYKNGFTTIRNPDGMLFNYPLMNLSIAIVDPEKASLKSYNEIFESAGRMLKSAKAKKDIKIVDEFDDESERGTKKVKVGWFTVGAFLLLFALSGVLNAETDISKKLILTAEPEATGAGQTVKLKVRVTDNRERPILGAFIVFEDQNKSDAKGSFSQGSVRTDKDGMAETFYTVGALTGKSMVKASWKADRVFSTVFIRVHANYLNYIFILVGFLFFVFTVLTLFKLFKLNPLFAGIDPEFGMKTRQGAELKISSLLNNKIKFSVLFIDFRNFAGFNREYGYEAGEKAAKALGESARSIIKELAPKDAYSYCYGEDKFVIIAKQSAEEIGKNLIEEMEIHIPLLCEDKNANYYFLHLSVVMISSSVLENGNEIVRTGGEIIQHAGRLMIEAKTKPGSTLLKG